MKRLLRLTLTQRLSLVFALLLLACSGTSLWLQLHFSARHEQAVTQQLSEDLAAHIAANAQLMDISGWRPASVRTLSEQLMAVNPSVEVYLLDLDGKIVGSAAPPGHIKRDHVDLIPIRRLLAGAMLPVFGDDPRNPQARKVFSVAPVNIGGQPAGYVYVILQGEAHDALAGRLSRNAALRMMLWAMAMVALLGLVMGLVAFRLITRPLRALTRTVQAFDANGKAAAALPVDEDRGQRDEIAIVRNAFAHMGLRITEQWRQLNEQDQQRREFIANISHDLRTPLTSLHGYLETLRLKDENLDPAERRRYLDHALGQSSKVGRLAQELFELARLESGLVQPELEPLSLPELIQDVLQKFELAVDSRQQRLMMDVPHSLPGMHADVGMIERVLTNLIDNASRHNPHGTVITVSARDLGDGVEIEVSDTGRGIPVELREGLFQRASTLQRGTRAGESGGLGLVIVQRMLQLHGSSASVADVAGGGSAFRFVLARP